MWEQDNLRKQENARERRKVIDKYRTALKSDITEAIICTKDWIFGDVSYNGDDAVNEIVDLETNNEGPSSVKSSTSFVDTNQ